MPAQRRKGFQILLLVLLLVLLLAAAICGAQESAGEIRPPRETAGRGQTGIPSVSPILGGKPNGVNRWVGFLSRLLHASRNPKIRRIFEEDRPRCADCRHVGENSRPS